MPHFTAERLDTGMEQAKNRRMSDGPEAEPRRQPSDLFEPVSLEDLTSVGLNAFLAAHAAADERALARELGKEAERADREGDGVGHRTFSLLFQLVAMHLRVDTPAQPFGPVQTSGTRGSMIPSDVRGIQNDVLAEAAPMIVHPILRARLGDVAFLNSRAHHGAGRAAMSAYCDIVRGRIDGTLSRDFPEIDVGVHDVVDPMRRAIQIMGLLVRRGDLDADVRATFDRTLEAAEEREGYVAFCALAEQGMHGGLIGPEQVAARAEKLARDAAAGTYPEAVKRVWLLAGRCHSLRRRMSDADRCLLAAAEATLRMGDLCQGALAKAHWTKQALAEMRNVRGAGERVAELRRRLRDLQDRARDHLVTTEVPMDLREEREAAIRMFGSLGLPEAFVHLMTFVQPQDFRQLRRLVAEPAERPFIDTLFDTAWLDSAGKEVARVPAPGTEGTPDEAWIKAECIRHLAPLRHQRVAGLIEPARQTLMQRFPVDERHLSAITQATPFAPPGHAPILALGFARMFQGDYVSAAHILFPQLENSLRHMLVLAGSDPAKIEADLLEGDRTLSALLDLNREDLERTWGGDAVMEIDLLFNFRPGPALRNELAHGKLPWNAFHSPETITGCWFIFALACRPVLPCWWSIIAPAIEAEL